MYFPSFSFSFSFLFSSYLTEGVSKGEGLPLCFMIEHQVFMSDYSLMVRTYPYPQLDISYSVVKTIASLIRTRKGLAFTHHSDSPIGNALLMACHSERFCANCQG